MLKSPELPDCLYADNQPTLICPKTPTPSHTLYLSNLDDQKFLRFPIRYLYIFRKPIDPKALKDSLSRVLVEYYPLAGRLRRCREGDDGKLEIECNGEGAVFAEAKMDVCVEEVLDLATKVNCRSLRKLLYSVDAPTFLGIPPLVIQVTNLRCGAMILCTAFNHCFCDGIGTSQFLHAWAHLTSQSASTELPVPPFHSRHVLKPRCPPQVNFSHPGFAPTEFLNSQTGPSILKVLQSQPLIPASITFSPSQILHMKRQCLPSLKCTAFEALASHTWRCWVKSLGLPHFITTKLLFSINIRDKLTPNLPRGYYGNGFVLACAEAEVKELVAAPTLQDGVKLVQHAKTTINDEYVRSMVDLLEDKAMRTDVSASLVISQWSKLGLQELDFGQGKAIHMGSLSSGIYCLFLPVVGQCDAVRVLVSMPESVVDKFEFYMMEFCGMLENGDAKSHYEADNVTMISV